MTQTLVLVAVFVFVLALAPMAVKWIKQRSPGGVQGMAAASRIVSVLAVGPHQRVITVEVGPEGARVWLTLGVTAQSINCLHTTEVDAATAAPPLPMRQTAASS